jgi:hypothetical protein
MSMENKWILDAESMIRIGRKFCMDRMLRRKAGYENAGFETKVTYDYPRKGQATLHYREVTH